MACDRLQSVYDQRETAHFRQHGIALGSLARARRVVTMNLPHLDYSRAQVLGLNTLSMAPPMGWNLPAKAA